MDELHTIVGAGAAEGAVDAANLLKPMLARGELRAVGATTLDEYKKHVEKDAALERRFQPIYVGEPIGRGHDRDPARPQGALRGAPRRHDHRRRADRRRDAQPPLHRRPLPARQGDRPGRRGRRRASRSSCRSVPTEIDEVERRIKQLEIEHVAVAKDDDRRPSAARRSSASSPSCASRRPACAPSGSARRSRPRATASCASASTRPAASSSAPSASSTTSAPPSCATARSPSSSSALAGRRGARPRTSYEPPVYLSERVDADEIAEVVGEVDRHPGHAACWRARSRS